MNLCIISTNPGGKSKLAQLDLHIHSFIIASHTVSGANLRTTGCNRIKPAGIGIDRHDIRIATVVRDCAARIDHRIIESLPGKQ